MNAGLKQMVEQAQAGQSPYGAADDDDAFGRYTRDQMMKEEVLRQTFYTEAAQMSIGEQLVGTQNLDGLRVAFQYPKEGTAEYPVDPNSTVNRQRIGWNDFDMTLYMAQARYAIDDMAKLEGNASQQLSMHRQRTSEALQRRKDENILSTVAHGAVPENVVHLADGEEWNSDTGSDVVERIQRMWSDLMVNAPLTSAQGGDAALAIPMEVWVELNELDMINNIQQALNEYIGRKYNLTILPHRMGLHDDHKYDMRDSAVMMFRGGDTAIHGVLDAAYARSRGVPLVEQTRQFSRGEDYLIKQWFNTKVFEHESGTPDKSPRIALETGINTNVADDDNAGVNSTA